MNDPTPASFPVSALERWHAAALPMTPSGLLGNARSLGVIVPHPDDETLGCGGLIAAAAALGVAVSVSFLTDGSASHPGSIDWPPVRLAIRRREEAQAAVARLTAGRGRCIFADAPDGRLAAHPGSATAIPAADLFVTCWKGDPHPDHVAAFAIAETVARRCAAPLLAFPLWTLTTDAPVPALEVHRIDVTAHLGTKRRALAAHRSQLGELVTDERGFVIDRHLQRLFLREDELFISVR